MTHKQRTLAVNVIVVVLLIAALVWILSFFVHPGGRAWTDNAQVRRDVLTVRCRVQGFAEQVRCGDFEHVEKGDTLIVIEDTRYRLQVAQAEAGYSNAMTARSAQSTSIRTTQSNLSASDAEVDEARLQMQQAERELQRQQALLASEATTRQQYEAAETRYQTLKARHDRLLRQQQSTRLVQSEQTQRLDQNEAAIAVAEAALQQARLDLGYTVVTAPCSGRTGRKMVQEGELLHQGQELLTIVSDADCWIDANFRERQLRRVAVGAAVRVKVDALGGAELHGRVAAIADATGAQFSAVPQDNSTGNFVKVEQLVPVRIELPAAENDADLIAQLKSGMNVECRVAR